MGAHGPGDGDRRGGVPFVLSARVYIGIDVSEDHRGDLRTGRSDGDQFHVRVEYLEQPVEERRRAAAADGEPDASWIAQRARWRRLRGGEGPSLGGQCDGAGGEPPGPVRTPLPEGDVDGPVGPSLLAVLTGAVEWIDDP